MKFTTSVDDWKVVRECYVKSFFNYPLYTYFVPDPKKREDFLRAYLDANFDVTIGKGKGVLLCLSISEKNASKAEEDSRTHRYKLIGAIFLVFPSNQQSMIHNDSLYWQAYEDHKLGEIFPLGLERVKR